MNTDRVHFGVKEYFCFYFGEKRTFTVHIEFSLRKKTALCNY